MNCRHCGSPYPDGALFCGECGRSVALSDAKRTGRTREAWIPDLMRITKARSDAASSVVAPVVDGALADAVRAQREVVFAARSASESVDTDPEATPPVSFLDAPAPPTAASTPAPAVVNVRGVAELPEPRAAAPITPAVPPRAVSNRAPRPSRTKPVPPSAVPPSPVEPSGEIPIPVSPRTPALARQQSTVEAAAPAASPATGELDATPVTESVPLSGSAAVPAQPRPQSAPNPQAAPLPVDPSSADLAAFAAPVPAASHREVTAAQVTVLPELPGVQSGPSAPIIPVPDFGPDEFDDDGPVDLEETRLANDVRTASRYILQFSTGESVTVRGSGLIGRNPAAQPGEYLDQIIPLFDAGRSVSKTHLEFGQESGRFWVLDRFSTNGTVIRTPDQEAQVCEPNRRYLVARGSRIDIGEQFFVVS